MSGCCSDGSPPSPSGRLVRVAVSIQWQWALMEVGGRLSRSIFSTPSPATPAERGVRGDVALDGSTCAGAGEPGVSSERFAA